ncbi:MAG: LysR substrate-binding domain-containing protein, partial [Pseudomonadota bacterium]|nr:LysR substrate-binding domain-containing protein [Pseudomonadota bacterium]
RAALGALERLEQAARDIRSGETETLVVAGHPSASISLLPEVVADLRRRRPDARISLINRSSEEVSAAFEAGALDLAVAEWPIHLQGVDIRRHAVDCVAIAPTGHPLAERPALTPADLAAHPLIGMSDRRFIGHQVRELFVAEGLAYDPVIVSEFFAAMCGLVLAGAGVAVVDAWSARSFAPLGLVVRPFRPALRYEIGVFRRASASPTPLATELMALIETRLTAPAPSRPDPKDPAT